MPRREHAGAGFCLERWHFSRCYSISMQAEPRAEWRDFKAAPVDRGAGWMRRAMGMDGDWSAVEHSTTVYLVIGLYVRKSLRERFCVWVCVCVSVWVCVCYWKLCIIWSVLLVTLIDHMHYIVWMSVCTSDICPCVCVLWETVRETETGRERERENDRERECICLFCGSLQRFCASVLNLSLMCMLCMCD